jgi:hypothetical protein
MLSVLAVTVLAGCGNSSAPAAEKKAETRFVALANAVCRESNALRASGAQTQAQLNTELARLRALATSVRKQPRFAALNSDLAARRKLLGPISKKPNVTNRSIEGGAADPLNLLTEAYRLDVKIYTDEKALGLSSCAGSPPRAPVGG